MGWVRDTFQEYQIGRAKSIANESQLRSHSNATDINYVDKKLDNLILITQAIWELLAYSELDKRKYNSQWMYGLGQLHESNTDQQLRNTIALGLANFHASVQKVGSRRLMKKSSLKRCLAFGTVGKPPPRLPA